jgi:ABC-type antimicrobial peptide transport system permease subunit
LQIWTEGLLISLFGGIVGAGIGVAAILALGQWSAIPVLLDPLILAIPCVLVLLTSLAGLVPAFAAAQLDPAQALRPTAAG